MVIIISVLLYIGSVLLARTAIRIEYKKCYSWQLKSTRPVDYILTSDFVACFIPVINVIWAIVTLMTNMDMENLKRKFFGI